MTLMPRPLPHADPDARPQFTLAGEAVHEFYAGTGIRSMAMTGGVLALMHLAKRGPKLWVRHAALDREHGAPYAAGLAEFGVDPAQVILVRTPDVTGALQAGLEGARCHGLGAVMIELWGEAKAYDLTASRRLVLAAKASGIGVFITRMAATPHASAAETRWLIHPAPSRALAARAPGHPLFDLTLLRTRHGREGLRYLVEWDRDVRDLVIHAVVTIADSLIDDRTGIDGTAPLSRAVAALPVNRPGMPGIEPAAQRHS